MESVTQIQHLEQLRSVIEVTYNMAYLAKIYGNGSEGVLAWRYNPGRHNAPGHRSVGEDQAG